MKMGLIILTAIFSVILSMNFVAAALPAPPAAFNSMAEIFRDLLVSQSGDDLIARVLLIMLLTAVLFKPAMNFTGKKTGMAFLVAFLVSTLGVRFFTTNESIMGLLLPYSALAITISAAIPFLLITYLVEDSDLDSLIRKLMFGIMAAAFISLWWLRWTNIGELAYVYLAMGVVSLLILLFLDSTLHMWIADTSDARLKSYTRRQISEKEREYADLLNEFSKTEDDNVKRDIYKAIDINKSIRKELKKML